MKRTLIALACLASTAAFAQSNVTIYGRLNTTVEYQKNIDSTDAKTVMQNNASRLGFKGTEDLGGGLKALFMMEHRFNSDTGTTTGDFWAGDAFVGLQSNYGTIRAGRITSPAYYATADYVSLHNHDTGTSEDKLYAYIAENKNTVAYLTPTFGGLNAEFAASAGEGNDAAKTWQAAVNYDAGPLHLGAGYAENDPGDKQVAIRALYELGAFTFGGYYQYAKDETGAVSGLGVAGGDRNAVRGSVMYTLGASEFHVNVGWADEWDNIKDSGAIQYTLGYNYNLSKRTKVYAFYTKVDNDSGAAYFTSVGEGKDPSSFAVGVRHNF